MIEDDISTTLPSVHIFHPETGPLYQELKDMLCAWVVSRSDEGLGYALGAAKIAAMLLITMPVQQAFVVMRNLLERHCIRSFFGGEGTKDEVNHFFWRHQLLSHIVRQVEAYYRWSLRKFYSGQAIDIASEGYLILCSQMACPRVSTLGDVDNSFLISFSCSKFISTSNNIKFRRLPTCQTG
jgi:Rab-GTPase-TBC domain